LISQSPESSSAPIECGAATALAAQSKPCATGLLVLDRSFELGCNSFDTARSYGGSERTLGAWIRERRNRGKVVVISKGCYPDRLGHPRLSPSDVSHDLNASLKALGTDFIDLYLLHYDHPTVRVEPVVEQLNRHIAANALALAIRS
jgi:aryl-alcohol dehydrogenase-like predicted oxidoreductase